MNGLPVDAEYTSALGVAVYAFATLEWDAIRCCERIRPGSIEELEDRTAGRVADTLIHLARGLAEPERQLRLLQAGTDFRSYVGTRNNLLHAKPGVDPEGKQRLFRDGDMWTLDELRSVALAFAGCSDDLKAWLDGPAEARR
jgi:hypothetical protein